MMGPSSEFGPGKPKTVFPPLLTALPSKTTIKPPQVSEQRIKPNELEEETGKKD